MANMIPAGPSTGAPSDSRSYTAKDSLELVGKVSIGLVGFCYVLGLIVVTVHLRAYGLNSLDLPQLHYVMAGVWAMLPILLTLLLIVLGIYFFQVQILTEGGATRWEIARNVLATVFVLLFLFYAVLGFFGGQLGLSFGWRSWVLSPLLGTLAAFVIGGPVLLFTRPGKFPDWGSVFIPLGVMAVGILLGVGYLVYFAGTTYQSIPWSTGGGRPSRVQLMIDPLEKEYLEAVGLKVSAPGNKTDPISLLMITEKEYVVLSPTGNAVSIPADTVKSVLYEK